MENKMNEINLTWKGPIAFEKFKDPEICKIYPDLKENGVYLFCLKQDNSKIFMVTYNGSAPKKSIYYRINQWYKQTLEKQNGSYLNYSKTEKEEQLEILLTAFDKIDEHIIKHNIESHFIFYSIPEEYEISILSKELSKPLEEIEGAIKNTLRRKIESRKYLTTLEYPKYGINPSRIINKLQDKDITIKGL